MIQLETTDKLQLVTSASCSIDVLVSYVNLNGTTVTADKQTTAITTANTTDILAAPGAGVHRVKLINIRNKHATSACDVTLLFDLSATDTELVKLTLNAGEAAIYTEGAGWQLMAAASTGYGDILERIIDADQTGTDVATAQQWFPTTGAVAVEAGVVYDFDGYLHTTRAAGAVSHTTGLLFAGTASLTYITWNAIVNTGDVLTNLARNGTGPIIVATNTTVKAASTSTTEATGIYVTGTVKINAAGTFIPQFIYSAAPGGVPTIKTGSYFRLIKKGSSFNTRGTWT